MVETKRQTTVRIWQDTESDLKHLAEQHGLSFGRMVNSALAEWLMREKGTPSVLNSINMWSRD